MVVWDGADFTFISFIFYVSLNEIVLFVAWGCLFGMGIIGVWAPPLRSRPSRWVERENRGFRTGEREGELGILFLKGHGRDRFSYLISWNSAGINAFMAPPNKGVGLYLGSAIFEETRKRNRNGLKGSMTKLNRIE